MKKGKLFAPFLMLLAGLIASVMMYCNHYDSKQMLWILILVMMFFYIIGYLLQRQVAKFIKKIKEEEAKEGEVIEKEAPGEETDEKASKEEKAQEKPQENSQEEAN